MSGTPLLIMSIIGLLCCPILGPISWILANTALKSGTVPPEDIGKTNTARILGIIGTVFLVLGIIARLAGVGRMSGNVTTTGTSPAPSLVVTVPVHADTFPGAK